MTELNLYLVRHGQPAAGVNPGLSDIGQQQAALLAEWVKKNLVCKAIFTSDMRRAWETALVLDNSIPVSLKVDVRLREYTGWDAHGNPGDLDNPNGAKRESWGNFCTRVKNCLAETADAYYGQTVVWVAHGGLFDVMVAAVLKLGTSHTTTFIHHTGLSHFVYDNGKMTLGFHDRTEHLPPDLQTY